MEFLKTKRFISVMLIPFTAILLYWAEGYPQFVERMYTNGIYRMASGIFGRIFGLVPFSVAEFLIVTIIVFSIYCIVRLIRRLMAAKEKTELRKLWGSFLLNLLCTVSITYFLFGIFCGANYRSTSFTQRSSLEVSPSSVDELAILCDHLVEATNASREKIAEDTNGVMTLTVDSPYQLAQKAQALYPKASALYPALEGYVAKPKPVLASRVMSLMDIGGVYFPFTFEPNINVDMPDSSIPSTMMHEMSHFKGFMQEQEANFLAYVTCRETGDPDFVYSGNMLALIHSTNALYHADKDAYWEVMDVLSPSVRTDMRFNSAYWQQFEGPVAEVSTAVNDTYLKVNRQSEGVKSYGQMVDLLLAEWRQDPQRILGP